MMLLALLSCATTTPTPDPIVINAPPGAVSSGSGCSKTSCSLGDAAHHSLGEDEFVALLDQWAAEPLGESTLALDTLLFDAERSSALLDVYGDRLAPERRAYLERELARTEVVVEMRLVDEKGTVVHSQLVPEITTEPDYEAAIAAL